MKINFKNLTNFGHFLGHWENTDSVHVGRHDRNAWIFFFTVAKRVFTNQIHLLTKHVITSKIDQLTIRETYITSTLDRATFRSDQNVLEIQLGVVVNTRHSYIIILLFSVSIKIINKNNNIFNSFIYSKVKKRKKRKKFFLFFFEMASS